MIIPIKIDLPKQIECKIQMTDAAIKGQTAASSYKPALLKWCKCSSASIY